MLPAELRLLLSDRLSLLCYTLLLDIESWRTLLLSDRFWRRYSFSDSVRHLLSHFDRTCLLTSYLTQNRTLLGLGVIERVLFDLRGSFHFLLPCGSVDLTSYQIRPERVIQSGLFRKGGFLIYLTLENELCLGLISRFTCRTFLIELEVRAATYVEHRLLLVMLDNRLLVSQVNYRKEIKRYWYSFIRGDFLDDQIFRSRRSLRLESLSSPIEQIIFSPRERKLYALTIQHQLYQYIGWSEWRLRRTAVRFVQYDRIRDRIDLFSEEIPGPILYGTLFRLLQNELLDCYNFQQKQREEPYYSITYSVQK